MSLNDNTVKISTKVIFKYDSIFEMFEDILGKEKITYHKRRMSKQQKQRNLDLQKAVYEYIKQIDEAFEATKGSTLQFD